MTKLMSSFALVAFMLSGIFSIHAENKKPNIVFIYADDLDADEINCTMNDVDIWPSPSGVKRVHGVGHKAGVPKVLTPHIDKLADEGMILTRFYVNATVCSSSRYCLLTGRYATRGIELQDDYPAGTHATLEWRPAILNTETSLPKELKKQGYRTGIIGKWHNMKRNDLPKRKKADHAPNATLEQTKKSEKAIKKYYQAGIDYLSNGFGWDVVDRMEWGNSIVNLDWQCEGAVKFINESKDQPFFLYCSLPVPHGQYYFDYNDITTYNQRVTSDGLLDEPLYFLPKVEDVFKRTRAAGVPDQNAMATRMDDYVGAVMDALKKNDLLDNTLVIFTSDHGGRGKNSCYEGGSKVPLIAVWPGKIAPGTRHDTLCGNIDMAATLVEVAGGTLAADMAQDSKSIVPQLTGNGEPADWRKYMFVEAGNTKAVFSKDWKLLVNRVTPEIEKKMKANPKKVFWTGVDHHNYGNERMYKHYWDSDQLYNLKADVYEMKNLINNPEYRPVLETLKGELSKFVKGLPHTFGEFGQ
ncbi:sulfatase-like hydrolase/transferase [Lentisphaera marina]|uniref:sulfatase family protein n=1 Tax=Lentisphaera marina TaxID=1111041 RepID=UPI00236720D4|nr:sulfatase-like hydrolase/transferase [Lentisphaera marina]MDD7986685.1 sulfatase-like hydrolase/transferase [Lentisphaera marina]